MSSQVILDEVWLSKLSQASNIEVDTCHRLWTVLYRQIELRLSLGYALDLHKLGVWSCQMKDEYVAILKDEKRYLIPPTAFLHIGEDEASGSMPRLTLDDLSESLAALSGATSQICERYLSQIVPLAIQLLEAGRELSLPSLGVLSPKIQDAGTRTIGFDFVIATNLRDSLNKAFSVFAPVPLVEEAASLGLRMVHIESLETLSTSDTIEVRWLQNQEELNGSGSAAQIEYPAPPAAILSNTNESLQTEISAPLHATLCEDQSPEKEVDIEVLPLVAQETNLESEASKRKKNILPLTLLGLVVLGILGYIYLKSEGRERIKEIEPASIARTMPLEEQTMPKDYPADTSAVSVMPLEHVDTLREDSTMIPNQEQLLPVSIGDKNSQEVADAASNKAQEKESITLNSGEGLMQISLRKYGHKVFWVYIYEENRNVISNYNNIPQGTKLTLPSARKYGINARDTNSVNRALILQRALLQKQ